MAIGNSGRVVIDLNPEVKRALHLALKKNGLTLKEWFERKAKSDFPEAFNKKANTKVKG